MGFDLDIQGGRAVTIAQWQEEIARLGLEVAFHPNLVMEHHEGFLPVRLVVGSVATSSPIAAVLAKAPEDLGSGPLAAGFEFNITVFGPGADANAIRQRIEMLDNQIALLREREAPDLIIDRWTTKRAAMDRASAGLGSATQEQSVSFRSSAGRTLADAIAQCVCAAAYAIAADARLLDPQSSDATGAHGRVAIVDVLKRQLAEMIEELKDEEPAEPFESWR